MTDNETERLFDLGLRPKAWIELDPGTEDAWRRGESVAATAFYEWPSGQITTERTTAVRVTGASDDSGS